MGAKKLLVKYALQACGETSAHGCLNFTQSGRHRTEHLTWVLALVGAATGACLLCSSTWRRYQNNPVVTSLERNYKEWKFIVQSVYVCPDTYYNQTVVNETATSLVAEAGGGPEEVDRMSNFLQALANASSYSRLDALEPFAEDKNLPTKGFLDLVIKVRHQFYSEPLLTGTITDAGICYATNSLLANYTSIWPSIRGYRGPRSILKWTTPIEAEKKFHTTKINSGFYVYLQAADALPDPGHDLVITPEKSIIEVKTRAQETYSTDATRSLSVAQRRCRFHDETLPDAARPYYSNAVCREACRAQHSHNLCGCRPYFINASAIPECDVAGLLCLSKYSDLLRFLKNGTKNVDCGCLPGCNEFGFQISSLVKTIVQPSQVMASPAELKHSVIECSRIRFKRDVLFSAVDLFVSFGGAVGLCLGCSVITMVEFLYFFTIRAAFALHACSKMRAKSSWRRPPIDTHTKLNRR